MKAIVDCNSFYCSCEKLFRPDLENKPVAVLSNNDGCIIARSDEAKQVGIDMGIPYYQAKELIKAKQVTVFSSNYNLYGNLSWRVMETLRTVVGTHNVEVYSVDEAFLDLAHIAPEKLNHFITELKDTVEQWTGIKVSIGVAPTKVLSKVANRLAKKNKQATNCIMILDHATKIKSALAATAVEDIWGVGRQYAYKLKYQYGIHTALQLAAMPENWAQKNLGGVVGIRLIKELNSQPCITLKDPLLKKKMIATTRMFGSPVYDIASLKEAVATYTTRAAEKLRRQFCAASSLSVFVVINLQQSKSYSPTSFYQHIHLPEPTTATPILIQHALPLVDQLYKKGPRYLKAGVILSNLVPDIAVQGNLFQSKHTKKLTPLMQAIDNLNFSMRDDVVKYVSTGLTRNWKMRQALISKRYTTRWDELYAIK